jgi:hypothetical protein
MRNAIPCPSPRGTNHERLYIVRQPHLALDAAMPDDGAAPDDNAAEQAHADLYQHLSNDTEGLALLKHLMDCMTDDGASAMDEPEPFTGQPRVGATAPGSGSKVGSHSYDHIGFGLCSVSCSVESELPLSHMW